MKLSRAVKPISYFKAHASEIIRQISGKRETLVITQNGEAKAVVQDIRQYEETQESLALIQNLPTGCRFSDWPHEREPGCVVLEAVKSGALSSSRLENYHRLVRELAFEHEKADIGLVQSERKRWKGITKFAKEIKKGKGDF